MLNLNSYFSIGMDAAEHRTFNPHKDTEEKKDKILKDIYSRGASFDEVYTVTKYFYQGIEESEARTILAGFGYYFS